MGEPMPDRLFLSFRLRGYTAANMLRHYERMLLVFPFSRLSTGSSVLRINALSESEPPVYEHPFPDPPEVEAIIAAAREFTMADCVVQLDSRWDIWQFDTDWKLAPANVTLVCIGPEFDSDELEHLRIDFGLDAHFLPQRELPNHLFMARSNIRSLLHLVSETEKMLSVDSKRLWSESGENFAERLQAALEEV
jgi:hypothetical protein